jgi:hypothetical protein
MFWNVTCTHYIDLFMIHIFESSNLELIVCLSSSLDVEASHDSK